jgi:hypothetical protein
VTTDTGATAEAEQPKKKTNWGCLGFAALPLAIIASCGIALVSGEGEDEPEGTYAQEQTYDSDTGWDDEERQGEVIGRAAFLLTLKQEPLLANITDDNLLAAGEGVCTALDADVSIGTLLQSQIATGGGEASAMIIGAAANSLCPEYAQDVTDFANTLG